MKQIVVVVDSSMKRLSIEALTLQIGPAESQLASFLLVLSFYGESLSRRGFVTVSPTIALQVAISDLQISPIFPRIIFKWNINVRVSEDSSPRAQIGRAHV